MTLLASPPPPVAPSPEGRPRPRHGHGAVTTVLVTLGALLLVALLNCEDVVRAAQRLPFGTERTISLRLANADHTVSHALLLDRPRQALDRLFGHEHRAGSSALPPVQPTAPTAPTVRPSTPGVTVPERPTAAQPLHVYLGGDSVADQVADSFVRMAEDTKVIRVVAEGRISTGLTRPDYFDWPGRLQKTVTSKSPPQVVVVMFGANDVQPIMTPSGPAHVGTAAWLKEYRRRVAATMASLSAAGVDVYWVGQPLMQSSYFNGRIGELDAIFASEAARHPHITFVDTRPVLADAHGHYAAYLTDESGNKVLVRAGDGVHLTVAGARRISGAILTAIGRHWQLPPHAVR